MQASTLLKSTQEKLRAAGVENPPLDARLLLEHVLDVPREALMTATADEAVISQLEKSIARRIAGEPVSRILGRRGFWSLEFDVTPDTLDPRADSETLIESALKIFKDQKNDPLQFLDLGTGTGCLLLSLLSEFPHAKGTGLDISEGAVQVAQKNAKDLRLGSRAEFIAKGWASYTPDQKSDLIISNPPYIREAEIQTLAAEVKDHDPHLALSGGADGLDCYREIARLAPEWLTPGGWLVLEIGYDQAADVTKILENSGFQGVSCAPDLAGQDRCLTARIRC